MKSLLALLIIAHVATAMEHKNDKILHSTETVAVMPTNQGSLKGLAGWSVYSVQNNPVEKSPNSIRFISDQIKPYLPPSQ